jgi:cbb3-type cytochrome oxidase subunit 3
MFKNILTHMYQVETWPIISLVFFVVFFVGMMVWALRLSKKHVSQMSQLPLLDNELN